MASIVGPMPLLTASTPVCLRPRSASIAGASATVLPSGLRVPSLVPASPCFGAWNFRGIGAFLGLLLCSLGWVFSSPLSWYIVIIHAHLDVGGGWRRDWGRRDWGGWGWAGGRGSWAKRECRPLFRNPSSLSRCFFVHLLVPREILTLEKVVRHLRALV